MTEPDYSGIRWGYAMPNFEDYPYQVDRRGIKVFASEEIPDGELDAYIHRGRTLWKSLRAIYLKVVGEDVEIYYVTTDEGFERIRRITGYLVGTLDRFNDAKAAEERSRVKHSVKSLDL